MNDYQIIELLFQREERAIAQLQEKYGKLCTAVARHILPDQRDCEECVSDTWIKTWAAIPPNRPKILRAYLARITRNIALDKYSYNTASRRSTALEESFEELEPSLSADNVEQFAEADDLRKFLRRFLNQQPKQARIFFVRRYWYGESIREIADACRVGEGSVRSSLFRTRNRLQAAMRKECITLE